MVIVSDESEGVRREGAGENCEPKLPLYQRQPEPEQRKKRNRRTIRIACALLDDRWNEHPLTSNYCLALSLPSLTVALQRI